MLLGKVCDEHIRGYSGHAYRTSSTRCAKLLVRGILLPALSDRAVNSRHLVLRAFTRRRVARTAMFLTGYCCFRSRNGARAGLHLDSGCCCYCCCCCCCCLFSQQGKGKHGYELVLSLKERGFSLCRIRSCLIFLHSICIC